MYRHRYLSGAVILLGLCAFIAAAFTMQSTSAVGMSDDEMAATVGAQTCGMQCVHENSLNACVCEVTTPDPCNTITGVGCGESEDAICETVARVTGLKHDECQCGDPGQTCTMGTTYCKRVRAQTCVTNEADYTCSCKYAFDLVDCGTRNRC